MNRQHHFEAGGEARKYQELTFGFPCTEQPSARIHTRQKPLRRKKKSEKDLALVALALLMYAFVRNQAVWVASTDKTDWRIIIYVSGKLPTYPSPKPTLTLSSHFGQNIGLRDG